MTPIFIFMDNKKRCILTALIALFLLLGTFVFLYHRNGVKSQEIAQYEQNWIAANDSVEYYKLKNGELMAERASYIMSESNMKRQLDMSDSEIKDLKNQLGAALSQIAKIESAVRIDSIYISTVPDTISCDTISAPFSYKDNWLSLSGRFEYGSGIARTMLGNIDLPLPLTVGTSENNKFFVSTPNPYVRITEINSVLAPQKKSHFKVGLNVGPSLGWDILNNRPYAGLGVSVGVNYNF